MEQFEKEQLHRAKKRDPRFAEPSRITDGGYVALLAQQAIVRAYNEKVETPDEDEEELAQYGSVRDIRADSSLSEAERKRRIIRAKRKGLPR